MTQQLEQLAGAYFHQDYGLDFGSPEQVIDGFIADEGSAAIAELVSEIDQLLASCLTDNEIRGLWIKEWHASYDPGDDGQSMRDWLTSLRARLAA